MWLPFAGQITNINYKKKQVYTGGYWIILTLKITKNQNLGCCSEVSSPACTGLSLDQGLPKHF